MDVSVIIPAHNPRPDYLKRAIAALRAQTFDTSRWELLLVDNASQAPLRELYELSWHPNAAHVREDTLGLTAARIAGFARMRGKIAVLVDDDNVLAPDFLDQALAIANEFPFMGAWSGQVDPEFERENKAIPRELYSLLTLRKVAADKWSNDPGHHDSTPWGAGLCVRRQVADAYRGEVANDAARGSLDLKGDRLVYGGDTDIAYTGCQMGFGKGVFARLRVLHLIPEGRCTTAYLCRVAEGRGYTEVLHHFARTGIVAEPPRFAASDIVRYLRIAMKPAIERETARAYLRGRRQAFDELLIKNHPAK